MTEGSVETRGEAEKRSVTLYSDGACRGNPGLGAYAAIISCEGQEKEIADVVENTTNNRMELQAAIKGLEALTEFCRVRVVTDSQYLFKGMTEWVDDWKKKGWVNSKRKPVLNRDLWERLLALTGSHDVQWKWIRGHSGDHYNERCDRLANRVMDEYLKKST